MADAAQNTNNTTIRSILLAQKLTGSNFTNLYRNLTIVLKYEKKIKFVEQPTGPAPYPETTDPDTIENYYETVNLEQEVACIMLSSMSPDLQRTLEKYNAYDMLKELKTMFEEQMKSYLDILERLGYAMPHEHGVSLILNSLNKDYDLFVQNYNMHSMRKTIAELHAMLKLHEKGIPKKAKTPAVLAIHEGKIQKDKRKMRGAKGKNKGKNKLAYALKPKIPPPPKRDNLAKDSICQHYKEGLRGSKKLKHGALSLYMGNGMRAAIEAIGVFDLILPSGLIIENKKRKNASVASTSSIFNIELYDFPNKSWVYDTGCGTRICNTSHGLRGRKKLKHGALSLYVGNGMRAAVEAIGSFDLILPSGLIIVLDNCHFTPTVTRGVVSISRLVENGYIHTFTNYGISVSKDNVFYFNAIPHDGIYEIDMHNLYPNVSSTFNVSNKRAKHALDSYYLWHCRLGHINKKRIDKLQRDGILQSTHDESLEKCKSCISGKMASKPFSHQVERAKDLLGLIHTDVCGPFRTVSREGASYFITFTDDFSRYGYVYLMKHKHEVFETFKVFQNEVENQLGKKIKVIRFDRGGEYMSHEFVNHMKSCARILNMVPTKKVERMPYEIWHGKAPKLSYLRVWGCEALVKRDAPDKLDPRSIKCIFVGYPKETMGYYFYYPPENKIFVARNAKFFQKVVNLLLELIQQNPGEIHWTAVKTILKYLRNTKDMVLVYGEKPEAELKVSFVDWKSAKQSTTAMSSTEAEYIVAVETSMEAIWMRKFIDGLGDVVPSNKRPMEMLCDNEPAIAIAADPGILKGARHFQKKYHYIREVIQEREIVLKKVHTDDNVADPFTKPMSLNKTFEHAMAIGIVPASSLM
ncbi:retrotransposon protein, putative, ty1-copia subclass [Tanacetum coccineum]|uniref:Retrotransposon protein, putative, ty1-copia subclass n=1 Tax=Tanacetum coccineum TaxID=301880 RepID=A0ABQ5E7I0_9ASTR